MAEPSAAAVGSLCRHRGVRVRAPGNDGVWVAIGRVGLRLQFARVRLMSRRRTVAPGCWSAIQAAAPGSTC